MGLVRREWVRQQQAIDLKQKKVPRQVRAQATLQAILQASAQVLIQEGYAGLTTNAVAERAGVSIGSVYEYFPGKEAIVAVLTTRAVADTLREIEDSLNGADPADLRAAMNQFVRSLYRITCERRDLLKILLFQVPFVHEIPAMQSLRAELIRLVLLGAGRTRHEHQIEARPETLYLIGSMTAAALLQLAITPPPGLDVNRILDELAEKVVDWLVERKS
ncbi:MAG TPA: TetR/AcrR family transcriptional regulator [Candidatus Kapabacteria bacterium]|nr:TetR/AcrR family transcriptional regulator [Candidatus Kapabacteria bacterium]